MTDDPQSETSIEFERLAGKVARQGPARDLHQRTVTRAELIEVGLDVVSTITSTLRALAATQDGDPLTYAAAYSEAADRLVTLQSSLVRLMLGEQSHGA